MNAIRSRPPRSFRGGVVLALLGVASLVGVAGCQEKLTTPADCPALCPGGHAATAETLLVAIPGGDSTYPDTTATAGGAQGTGYVARGIGQSLRVSSVPEGQLAPFGTQEYALMRFIPRGDSVRVGDTLRAVTSVDSATISVFLQNRDPAVPIRMQLIRLPAPALVASGVTYAPAQAAIDAGIVLADSALPDTLRAGSLRFLFSGAALANLPGGKDSLALAVRIVSATPTGVGIGSVASPQVPTYQTYVHVQVADTGQQRQQISRGPVFNTFVSRDPLPTADSALLVGDAPSRRALVRFTLSPRLRDTATIVRATLELTPAAPSPATVPAILGLASYPDSLQVRALLIDLGPKSPLVTSSDNSLVSQTLLVPGSTEPVRVDVTRLVRLWQGASGRPPALLMNLKYESASFTRAFFGSTATERLGREPAARLRIEYAVPFPFEAP
jgi:hypothetical protein